MSMPRSRLLLVLEVAVVIAISRWHMVHTHPREVPDDCHSIWRELASGHIGSRDPVEKLIELAAPSRRDKFGRFEQLEYYKEGTPPDCINWTSICVTVKDGRVRAAGACSCIWSHQFFTMSSSDWDAYFQAHEAYSDEQYRKWLVKLCTKFAITVVSAGPR